MNPQIFKILVYCSLKINDKRAKATNRLPTGTSEIQPFKSRNIKKITADVIQKQLTVLQTTTAERRFSGVI